MNFFNFPYFQLWVRPLSASFFGYHWLNLFKAEPKSFLQLKIPALPCTSRLHLLIFAMSPRTPQIRVVNVFIRSFLNFHFHFPHVSWLKIVIPVFQLSNTLLTTHIALLDPKISYFKCSFSRDYFLGDFICV